MSGVNTTGALRVVEAPRAEARERALPGGAPDELRRRSSSLASRATRVPVVALHVLALLREQRSS